MANRTTQIIRIHERAPKMNCKGLCQSSCRPLLATKTERYLMTQAGGEPEPNGDFCAYLQAGRCSIHDDRPLICRLWGAEPTMPCPHGCEVEGGMLTFMQSEAMIRELEDLDGRAIPVEESSYPEYFQRIEEIEARGE